MSNLPPEYLRASVRKPVSPSEVKAGTITPAVMLTAVDSDLPGQITGQRSGPFGHRKDADTRAAGNGGPIPSFPGNRRSGFQLIPNLSTLVSGNENSWASERREGRRSLPRFSPGDAGVESTAPNFVQPLRKRVADMKHGFEPGLNRTTETQTSVVASTIQSGPPQP